jgi:hypothetical protein
MPISFSMLSVRKFVTSPWRRIDGNMKTRQVIFKECSEDTWCLTKKAIKSLQSQFICLRLVTFHVLRPKWRITFQSMRKKLWGFSCLLISQTWKRLAKMYHDTSHLINSLFENIIIFPKNMLFMLSCNWGFALNELVYEYF